MGYNGVIVGLWDIEVGWRVSNVVWESSLDPVGASPFLSLCVVGMCFLGFFISVILVVSLLLLPQSLDSCLQYCLS